MGFKLRIIHSLKRLGLTILDLGILAAYLFYLYLRVTPLDNWGLLSVDGLMLFVWVVISYGLAVIITSLLTTYMTEDSPIRKFAKAAVTTLLTYTFFQFALPIILFMFGYSLAEDIKLGLIIVSVIRWIVKILLGRMLGMNQGGNTQ